MLLLNSILVYIIACSYDLLIQNFKYTRLAILTWIQFLLTKTPSHGKLYNKIIFK